ncbi:zinc/cadmium/mercury/lead-transporting ATPase [Utexia brackfieldae]|uniref:zinc/cadmium/mercury/lead-transporting ATPase n=1 Tax=Utexia brackfieldae TaxID=3074108 RepID=UPI00370DAA8E
MLYNNKSKKQAEHLHHHTADIHQHTHDHVHHDHEESDSIPPIPDTAEQNNPINAVAADQQYSWKIAGMDCISCAKKIENSLKSLPAVSQTRLIFATEKLVVTANSSDPSLATQIEENIRRLGFMPTRLDAKVSSEADNQHHDHDGHNHSHMLNKRSIVNLVILAVLIVISTLITLLWSPSLGNYAFILSSLFGLYPILGKAWRLIRAGSPFSIESLMSISALGALFIGAAEEASMVLFLFMIGEMLEALAANRAKKGISALVALMPEETIKIEDDLRRAVSSRSLIPGDIIEAASGSRLPADVQLISAMVTIDESALTGESMSVEYRRGETIMAGSMVVDKTVQLQVVSKSGQNAVDRILQLIENAEERKAPIERFIDKFSHYYTPAIVLLAVLVMSIPPLFTAQDWYPWIYRGLTLLLIGCPCALVISTPASITSALSTAARNGVLIKGGVVLEQLGHVQTMAFDKTGTLTAGKPQITDMISESLSEQTLLQTAAAVEVGSSHPLAKAIIQKTQALEITITEARERQAIAGVGIKGLVNDVLIYVISPNKAATLDLALSDTWLTRIAQLENQGKTVVLIANESHILGLIALQDQIRPEAKAAIAQIKSLGITPIMLTGDNARSAQAIATELAIDFRAQLLPADKLAEIETLSHTSVTAMIGDGINDSPAIKAATVGIAMGEGTDVALETADAALSKNNLLSVPKLIQLARATNRNIRQNISLALAVKAIFLITSILGMTGLWFAVLADSGTTALVTANALRLLKFKPRS